MPDFGFANFTPHVRSIGGIMADVTIEENERDDVTVTEHPVEQGAPIADHAFKRPEEVTLRVGFSEQKTGDLSAESGIYGVLLDWEASFVLFDLYTGKRRHRNMLIAGLAVTTDEHNEHVLSVTITCRQVILTKTQTASATGSSINAQGHADAGTAPVSDGGTQEVAPATTAPSGTGTTNLNPSQLPTVTGGVTGGAGVSGDIIGTDAVVR